MYMYMYIEHRYDSEKKKEKQTKIPPIPCISTPSLHNFTDEEKLPLCFLPLWHGTYRTVRSVRNFFGTC